MKYRIIEFHKFYSGFSLYRLARFHQNITSFEQLTLLMASKNHTNFNSQSITDNVNAIMGIIVTR